MRALVRTRARIVTCRLARIVSRTHIIFAVRLAGAGALSGGLDRRIEAGRHAGLRLELRVIGWRQRGEQVGLEPVQIADLSQLRQPVQATQSEVIQELTGRAVQRRTPWHLAVPQHADPLALHQGLDDVAAHRDTTHLLDLAARDRLAVRDQRERLEQRSRVTGRAFGEQATEPTRVLLANLQAVTARDFHQFDRSLAQRLAERGQRLAQHVTIGRLRTALEQGHEIIQAQRPSGGQHRGLEHVAQRLRCHGRAPGRGSARRLWSAPAPPATP